MEKAKASAGLACREEGAESALMIDEPRGVLTLLLLLLGVGGVVRRRRAFAFGEIPSLPRMFLKLCRVPGLRPFLAESELPCREAEEAMTGEVSLLPLTTDLPPAPFTRLGLAVVFD